MSILKYFLDKMAHLFYLKIEALSSKSVRSLNNTHSKLILLNANLVSVWDFLASIKNLNLVIICFKLNIN